MIQLRARLAEAQLALLLLTRLPAGRLPHPAPAIPASAWAFPLAGLAVGLIGGLTLWAAQALGLPAGVAAGLAVAAGLLATGALHEDGLADVADGFGGGGGRGQKLEIMRDSRIGSYGTLALIVCVGLRWQLLTALASPTALVAAAILSRGGLPAAMALMPPARAEGLGRQAAGVGRQTALIAAALAVVLAALAVGALPAVAMTVAAGLTLALVGRMALRQIGGQTGDVLGAMQQLSEIAALVVLAAVVGS